jgi:hypothetical protein
MVCASIFIPFFFLKIEDQIRLLNNYKDELDRRREDLLSKKRRAVISGNADDLERRKRELKMVMKKLSKLSNHIGGNASFSLL